MRLTVGIDVGTSACRVAVLDEQGHVLSLKATPLAPSRVKDLRCEQDSSDWWQACQTALSSALQTVEADQVKAIAIDGTSSTLLLCDESGQPVTPALMYRDQRAYLQADQLANLAPPDAAVHSATSSLSKLLWWQDQGTLKDGQHVLHQGDWLTAKFSGQYGTSDENNALKLGYDPVQRKWPEWMSALELPDYCLPDVVPAGAPIGPVLPEIAAQFGLPDDCLVVSGTTDSTATFIASGANQPGDAVTVLGSTLVIKILGEQPVFAPEYGVYSHRLGDQWLIGGASNTGGAVLEQFFDTEEILRLSEQINPELPTGLDYLPLPGVGERFPINDASLQPILEPRPDSNVIFLQGLLEGISRIEQRGYALLAELGAPTPLAIRTSGGGARNVAWQAIRSRLLNVPMLASDYEQAAVGAARLASKALSR